MIELKVETPDEINDVLESETGRVVVLFTAPSWCGPCRQFKPHWNRAVENTEDITFLYVDIDKVPDAAVEYDVRSVPTVMLYENGVYLRNIAAPQGAVAFIRDITA